MIPPAPLELLMKGHTADELDVLKSAAGNPTDIDATAMETADAAAVVQALQVSPISTRSSAAMQSLMEQGMSSADLMYIFLISEVA
jgi:hypothetical protein